MTVVEDGGDRVPSGTDGEVDLRDQRTDNMQGGIFPPKMNFLLDVIPGLTLDTLFERPTFSFFHSSQVVAVVLSSVLDHQ